MARYYREDINVQDEKGKKNNIFFVDNTHFLCMLSSSGRTPFVKAGGDSRFVLKIQRFGGDFGQTQCGGLTFFCYDV